MSYLFDWFRYNWEWQFNYDSDDSDNSYHHSEEDSDFLTNEEKEYGDFQKQSHDYSITAKQAINRKKLKSKSDKKKLVSLAKEIDYSLPKDKNHMSSNDIKTIKKQVRKTRRKLHKEENGLIVREKGEFDY